MGRRGWGDAFFSLAFSPGWTCTVHTLFFFLLRKFLRGTAVVLGSATAKFLYGDFAPYAVHTSTCPTHGLRKGERGLCNRVGC